MTLNCKQGDLAVIIKSQTGKSLGKVVRCVRIVDRGLTLPTRWPDGFLVQLNTSCSWWEVDTPITYIRQDDPTQMVMIPYCPDPSLRPLRDTDGEDETLAWAGKPDVLTLDDLVRRTFALNDKLMPVPRSRPFNLSLSVTEMLNLLENKQ